MTLRAGFAEIDISPPMGTLKVGWIQKIEIDTLLDPIFGRVAVFESEDTSIAFVQLDVICVRREEVEEIRRQVSERYGFTGAHVMVSTTHNHAGPAVDSLGEVPVDLPYVAEMVRRVVAAFGEALEKLQPAQIGFASTYEWHISHNRRMVMRDGTTRTHSGYGSPDALHIEGPIDPEVGVLAAKDLNGNLLGALVNFAAHPTDHGGDTCLSAGWPGVLAREMKAQGCPVPLFLNGAAGNLSAGNPLSGREPEMEEVGEKLAKDAMEALGKAEFKEGIRIGCRSRILPLPYRELTEEQIRGTARGAQRFVSSEIYDRAMPELAEKIRLRGSYQAEVQALFVGDVSVVGVPAELFVEPGLRVKEASQTRRALISAFTNGYAGYAPTREAFRRGGFETTFGWGSFLGVGAAEMMADCAIELVREGP